MINKQKLTKVAKTLLLEVNQEVLEQLENEYYILTKKLNRLKTIDVDHLEPLIWVDQSPTSLLRPDQGKHLIDPQIVCKNAPSCDQKFVKLGKVINEV